MRLAVETIKEAILHREEEVRLTAVRYFANSFSDDPSVMPLVIQAVETHGRGSAFRILRAAEHLVQTTATLDWLVSELRREFNFTNVADDNIRFALALVILSAPVELLAAKKAEVDALGSFPDELRGPLDERLQMAAWTWEQAWEALEEFGRRTMKKRNVAPIESHYADRLIETLAQHADRANFVNDLLRGAAASDDPLIAWLEPDLIQLAGEMRLEASVPVLVETLGADDLMLSDAAASALMRVSTDAVVEAISDEWWDTEDDFRGAAADVLETVHTDLCVETCRELLDAEEDLDTAVSLGHALLSHFALEAIDPVRELIDGDDDDLSPDQFDLRYHLTAAATVMAVTFPEYDAWYRDALKTNWGWDDQEPGKLANAFRPRPAASRRAGAGELRAPVEKIEQALFHSDRQVREAALFYFAKSGGRSPAVMPLVIQSIERFGLDAFPILSVAKIIQVLGDFAQTEDTAAWLIREIERIGTGSSERAANFQASLQRALRHADVALLQRHESSIQAMLALDEETREIIAVRLAINSLKPDALWRELIDFCDAKTPASETISDKDLERIEAVVTALGRFPDLLGDRVLSILSDEDAPDEWLEGLTIRLAGEMQLEAAIPHLVDRFAECGEWICEEASRALVRIGSDAVVEEIGEEYVKYDWPFRLAAATTLEDIHSDLSVQTCLDLFDWEQDLDLQGHLLQSMLLNFSLVAIEPARQFILDSPKTPDLLEVRSSLLLACKVVGETFPEFQEWLDDSRDDVEFRKKWYEDHPLSVSEDEDELDDDESDDEEPDDDGFPDGDWQESEGDEPPRTFVRREERTGRNDPCPCGSGKKFKKCCYGKEIFVEETDESHSAAMSGVRAFKSPSKYPIGTLAMYGPDDKTTTKMAAGVIKRQGSEAIIERWVGTNVKNNSKVQRQIKEFFKRHGVKSVVATDANIGCPHEEGLDFPIGEDCPFCPFWAGKQGSNQRD